MSTGSTVLRKLETLLKNYDYDPTILRKFRKYPDIILLAKYAETAKDAQHVYNITSGRFGTLTKRKMISEDPGCDIVIGGLLQVFQSSSSSFYYAFEESLPCVLKFPPNSKSAFHECNFYSEVASTGHPNVNKLVKMELRSFKNIDGRRNTAIKMPIYCLTLASVPRVPQLANLFLRAATTVAAALECIHESNYCHCDVKPSNIFVDAEGEFFLGDFDAVEKIGQVVTKITEKYVPSELPSLLYAFPTLDWCMFVFTFVSLVSDCPKTMDDAKQWISNRFENKPLEELRNLLKLYVDRIEQDHTFYIRR